jgi:hypothetical protein
MDPEEDEMKSRPTYSYGEVKNDMIKVTVKPPEWARVGNGCSIELTLNQFQRFLMWKNTRILIQNALPDLTNVQREILMTGIGPEEWNKLFPEEEEERQHDS